MDLLIKNGHMISPEEEFTGDLLVRDGIIHRLARHIEPMSDTQVQTIDASGMLVFPGGVDPHVHMNLPTAAGYSSDNFVSGSKAALMGGTTTIIDFVTPERMTSLSDALAQRKAEATNCHTDYSFHVSPTQWDHRTASEIKECIYGGLPSFKVYMAYKDRIGLDDEAIERVMRTVAAYGGIVAVHCESGEQIDQLRNELAASNRQDPASHPLSRPPQAESDAVKKAISLAEKTGCRLYIVHVSAAASVRHIREAQKKGLPVYGEVCPHHLLLDASLYHEPFEKAARYVMSPPLRSETDRNSLWEALKDNVLQAVSTDHCPFYMKQKAIGRHDFRKIANGVGGVEHRLPLLYTYGVLTGKISIKQFVHLCATQPARMFNLYPQKGIISEGADADLVVWNPRAQGVISAKTHHQQSDINIYEGMRTTGKAEIVIRKGEIAVSDGQFRNPSPGRFIVRHQRRQVDGANEA